MPFGETKQLRFRCRSEGSLVLTLLYLLQVQMMSS
jgi:hypothetical protein